MSNDIKINSRHMIGAGSTGRVFKGRMGRTDVAVKIVPLDVLIPGEKQHAEDCIFEEEKTWRDCLGTEKEKFVHEIKTFKYASKRDIAPAFYWGGICEVETINVPKQFRAVEVGIIVSKWMKAIAYDDGFRGTPIVGRLTKELKQRMRNARYSWFDLHEENIGLVLDKNGKPIKAYNIDVGEDKGEIRKPRVHKK